ncbi:hypothetical protein K2Z83_14160 [Oscillochloris sp. ZM17-4]|uniref:hypothetical protein n=1 Tax=Oscillochloris sp. ZM17-4 TaxID=2866714 RepID=UPI001C738302|nr:hypothetical protein [Oscillochloris sp. ZM17-4]MBX0328819.1 hypothetical protein [Oscillochloris sp. ZM17-4]
MTGTVVAGSNKVFNGDFSIPAGNGPEINPGAGFDSDLPNVGPDTYPYDENGGGFSIISTGVFTVANRSLIYGRPFPGDPRRAVAASQPYFYTKPNKDRSGNDIYGTKGYALLWTQQVTLTIGTTYNFFAYFNNMLLPSVGDNNFVDPQIKLLVNDVPAGDSIFVPETPDEWVPVQFSFSLSGEVGAQVPVTLQIRDYAAQRLTYAGDDFTMTGVNLKQCVSGLGVAFANLKPVDNGDGIYDIPFVVTLRNYGVDPLPITGVQVVADLSSIAQAVDTFHILNLSSPSLSVNSGFNGVSDTKLLSSALNVLHSGSTATITFTARIKLLPGSTIVGPFNIQVTASGQAGTEDSGSGGGVPIIVEDVSAPGLDPGPDDDFKDPVQDTPTPVYITPMKIYIPMVQL